MFLFTAFNQNKKLYVIELENISKGAMSTYWLGSELSTNKKIRSIKFKKWADHDPQSPGNLRKWSFELNHTFTEFEWPKMIFRVGSF
jgi:hypothetical protein